MGVVVVVVVEVELVPPVISKVRVNVVVEPSGLVCVIEKVVEAKEAEDDPLKTPVLVSSVIPEGREGETLYVEPDT